MKHYTIIIVENDEDEQFFMKEGFDASGLFTILAQLRSGNELFDWIEGSGQQPDVILSDLNMPGKNGYDILSGIAEIPGWKHIPIVITSTSSTPVTIEKCRRLGAAEYMVKPETFVEYAGFVERLHRLLTEKQLVK